MNERPDSAIPAIFLKPYNASEHETPLYSAWEASGYFNPDVCVERGVTSPDAESFSVVLPPPNVTGTLHMGHAAMLAIQDAVIRYQRMRGKRVLWIPGTDHAAIATQAKVEKELVKREKKNRHDLGREAFLARVEQFATESHDTIVNQVRKMGSSVDWSREAFTLDETRTRAVRTAFKNMFDAGLIYRGYRIVNWDPKGQTTISDDEIVHEEREAKLYTFRYAADFPIAISTTRPETKVGDTAVAVHPDDERYRSYVGTEHEVVFCDVPLRIKIIADESVDKDFGTGALGVTPAHSQIDWDIAERHNLPQPRVIDEYAKMNVEGRLHGTKVTEARELVVSWLKDEGLLEEEKAITQNISTSERTGAIIEPLPKQQWWVDTDKPFTLAHSSIDGLPAGTQTTLKQLMRHVVATGQIQLMPERFAKTYYHWIDNLRPWCISRQIWYGHRIPVWYRGEEIHIGDEPTSNWQDEGWEQDPDTLDTWFSSGLWTFSTLGWPDETEDLATYHPTALIETGYDILFFWVARMILMTGFHLGTVPFRNVYLHGLVRDEQGRKMSKSLGNSIDPLDMIEKYGADATRLSLVINNTPGTDLQLSEDRVRGYKHFANKIWNITRFVLTNTADADLSTEPPLTETDQARLAELERVQEDMTDHIERYRLDLAGDKLYHFVWHRFADEIIEEAKKILYDDAADAAAVASVQWTLYRILIDSLKMLHPLMPFVTETIWQHLPHKDAELLLIAPWPDRAQT